MIWFIIVPCICTYSYIIIVIEIIIYNSIIFRVSIKWSNSYFKIFSIKIKFSIDLIKLCLSRVSSGAKVFIEGDYLSQVDSNAFDGNNNGLKRMIDVFKGHEEFGYVQLQNVWRSKIAELCELL